jgi:hypothetical protein
MCGRTEATRRVRQAASNLSAACLALIPGAGEGVRLDPESHARDEASAALQRAFPIADDLPAEWRTLLDQIRHG